MRLTNISRYRLLPAATLIVAGLVISWQLGFNSASQATAAGTNFFVRPNGGAYGAEDGSDWNNAFDGFSDISWSSIPCGSTIWVAGGTYTQDLSPAKNCTSGSQLYIKRARSDAAESTGAAGWSSGFNSTILQNSSSINFNSFNYINVSGATTTSGGTQGWHISFAGRTSGTGIEWPNDSNGSNIRVEWIDIEGPGNVTYSSDGRGIDATPFSSAANITFSHLKIHDWESTVYLAGIQNVTFEYSEFYNVRAVNSAQFHPNMIYIQDSDNLIFRYNLAHGYLGEGIFFTNNDTNVNGAQIYGNVFRNTSITQCCTKIIQPDNTGTFTGLKIFNNTFDDVINILYGDSSFSGAEARNNIISRSGGSPWPGSFSVSNQLVTSNDVFVNRAGGDYHIVGTVGTGFPRNAGTALAATYNTDPDGNIRGADGTWDVGAYEYVSGGTPPPPPPPTPSVSISADPTSITSGQSSTLNWSATNVTSCSASGAWSGSKATSGTQSVSPTSTSTYTLTCTGTGGSANSSATVTVGTPTGTFMIGQQVTPTETVNVRQTPAGTLLGTQAAGAVGTVTGGPTNATLNGENVTWWSINFASGVDGWVGEDVLTPATTTPVVGDINLDHIVNSIDYSLLNAKWFTSDSTCDLNHDGLVNAIDYSLLNANWFKTW